MLSIGRFSQASRLSVRTLRRYDCDALLVPALVDAANGRRYYSPAQVAEARLIRLLRDLDLPLEEVRAVLGDRDPQSTHDRLAAHRDRLAAELDRQRAVLGELDDLLAQPRPLAPAPVEPRSLPEQLVVSCRVVTALAELPSAFGAAWGRVEWHLHEHGGRRAGPSLAIYHGPDFDPDALDVEVAVPVTGWVRVGAGIAVRTLPAVEVIATVHAGAYDRLGDAYQALAGWAGEHGRVLGEGIRETYLVGPDRGGPEGLRTEVAWPLAERDADGPAPTMTTAG
ncbi:MAG TPA: MerR family transcriptional regulator [Kineosporiaceae bacterium]|nr:MerR family transcriptional regulator [Kineosporiaceae bacterium]